MALIYVLEDDKSIQEIESFALTNVGYRVEGFETAKDFYKALENEMPDLILSMAVRIVCSPCLISVLSRNRQCRFFIQFTRRG